ncbi:hypothetical protein GCM10027072_03660 [Streptomyces bullii]
MFADGLAHRRARGHQRGGDGAAKVQSQVFLAPDRLRPKVVLRRLFKAAVGDGRFLRLVLAVSLLVVSFDQVSQKVHTGSLGAHLPVDPCDLSPDLGYLAA